MYLTSEPTQEALGKAHKASFVFIYGAKRLREMAVSWSAH